MAIRRVSEKEPLLVRDSILPMTLAFLFKNNIMTIVEDLYPEIVYWLEVLKDFVERRKVFLGLCLAARECESFDIPHLALILQVIKENIPEDKWDLDHQIWYIQNRRPHWSLDTTFQFYYEPGDKEKRIAYIDKLIEKYSK